MWWLRRNHQSYKKWMQQISTEGVQDEARLGRQGVPLGNVQEIEIWPYEQMVYAQPSSCPGEWDTQTPMRLWYTNGSSNLGQKTRPDSNQQKKNITCKIVDFVVPADHRIKLKETEKKDCQVIVKKYWIWRWRLYQSWLMHSEQ